MVNVVSVHLGIRHARHPLLRALAVLALTSTLGACSLKPSLSKDAEAAPADPAPEFVSPQDEVLAVLDSLSAGQAIPLSNGGVARAEATYDSASGRRCRRVEVGDGGMFENRLACRDDGVWAWFPFVLP